MLEGMLLDTPYDLAEMSDLQRPNLLDNADFKSGIINQLGKSSYVGTSTEKRTLTIDRWTTSGLTVDVGENYITLTNQGPVNQSWTQDLKILTKQGEIYTLFVDVKSMTEGCYVWGYTDKNGSYSSRMLQNGKNIFSDISQGWINVGISIPPSGSITLNGLKLEDGTNFTGIPVFEYATELLKCQRFLYRLTGWTSFNCRYDGKNLYIYITMPTTMEKIPTIFADETNILINTFKGNFESHDITTFKVVSYGTGQVALSKTSDKATDFGMALPTNFFYITSESL